MPLIFASSLLGLPLALARYTDSPALDGVASAVGPGGALYLPASVGLIAFFNYYYTFLQVGPWSSIGRWGALSLHPQECLQAAPSHGLASHCWGSPIPPWCD
jgi:hypothetical protein